MSLAARITLCRTVALLCLLNFLVFWVQAVRYGGSPGRVDRNRHFLVSHGQQTEVSADVYRYIAMHGKSVFVTHPLAIVFGVITHRLERRRREQERSGTGKGSLP